MKQQTVNEFKDGLNLDLHPLVTPKTVLTDNINGTFITYNGNEFCLQNDRGNKWVANLTDGYTPIGIKEHNGILYIVSVNGNATEIGTFPSPNYEKVNLEEAYSKEWRDNLNNKKYSPLHVLENHAPLTNIDLGYTIKTPVTIEIQDSYDGSVNLIIVADECKPRIINSGFSVLSNNQYKFINRNQNSETNIYNNLDKESELIRTSDILTNIDLLEVQSGGQFKGGNYTFYVKFGDADYNQTDVVAESGIVSIFNGNDCVSSTISGTLLDERTDKMIHLEIQGLNHVYSKIYIYYSREYSDTQGFRMTEYGMLNEPINMIDSGKNQDIWLTGFEQTTPIDSELLNVDYHTVDWARAEAQHSNMLFLGNVGSEETFKLYHDLEEFTLKNVETTVVQDDNLNVVTSGFVGTEYYSTLNIYNKLGYWPDEIYRFAIVYVLNDGSLTPAFNMCGDTIKFENSKFSTVKYIENEQDHLETYNEKGVFLTPDIAIIGSEEDGTEWVKPLHFKFELKAIPEKVIGWFVVRQKRIPRTICQGLSIGIDDKSHLPLIYNERYAESIDGQDPVKLDSVWKIQSFLSYNRNSIDYTELYNLLNSLDKKSKSWWKWLLVLASPALGPILGLSSTMIGLSKKLTAELTIDKLKKLIEDNKPLLEYKENVVGLNKEPNEYYAVRNYDNWSNTDINDWNNSKNTDEDYKYVDEHEILNATQDDTIYTNEYIIYRCVKNEDPESENEYRLENVQAEYDSGIKNLVVQYARLNNDSDKEPKEVQFVLNTETFTCPTAEDRESLENLIESIVEYNKAITDNRFIYERDSSLHGWGLLSLDPCVNSSISGMLDGSVFNLIPKYVAKTSGDDIITNYNTYSWSEAPSSENKCVFIPSNTNVKLVDEYAFSNIAGDASSVSQYKQITEDYNLRELRGITVHVDNQSDDESSDTSESDWAEMYHLNNINLVRGLFCPYIGVASSSSNLLKSTIYSIRLQENTSISNLFTVRYQDNSEYYAVSERIGIDNSVINVYRGDCYTNTVGIRILRNFIDSTAPYTENIVDPECWNKYVILSDDALQKAQEEGKTIKEAIWDNVNLSDVNTVDLGYWVTFKCLSSYNLGLRSVDTFHTDEMSLLGSPRSFYPLNGASTATGNKIEESFLLNDGLSATVGRKRYNLIPDVPYSKSEFANRIMFSNVNVTDAFTNGYRTFQGLSYKDYDKQYGAITKLISLGQNIFVVMEHGLGLVPVNPKALMQTTTGETIHIYGYGVLPDEMTIISQDYGSKYEHSVIRTPIGIYGMDVDAKKIWRFSDKQGFETISDMKIETYLNDYLKETPIEIGIEDVRAHYNGKKGDVMFTFYTNNKSIPESDYFNITQRTITLNLGETKSIVCYTNMDDSSIEFTNSDNVSCNYINKVLNVTGLVEGSGYIIINGINLTVTVKDQSEIIPEPEDTIPALLLDHASARLMFGQSCTLTPITNSSSDIIWTCDNLNIASVDNNGKITAGTVVGSAKITASLSDNPSVTATCSVITQSTPVSVIGVSLRPINIYFNGINKTKKLTTIFSPWTATNQNVEWSVSVGGNCIVDQNGVVTGLRHDRTGSVTVRTEDGGYMKSCSVVIDDSIIPVTGVQFNKSFLIMHVGEQAELNYTLIPSNATVQNVVWDSMYSSVVKVENGILTAQSSGISKIDIITKDGGFVATCLVAVI